MTSSPPAPATRSRWLAGGVAALSATALTLVGCGTSGSTTTTSPSATSSASTSSSAAAGGIAAQALTFEATLTDDQKTALLQDYSLANAEKWSNLPQALSQNRVGVQTSTFSDAQWTALDTLLKAASGTASNEGYDEITQLWNADDYLADHGGNSGGGGPGGGAFTPGGSGGPPSGGGFTPPSGGGTGQPSGGTSATASGTGTTSTGDYGRGNYYLAFLGTPSDTGTWELQFGGHHLAFANTYTNGKLAGATPSFRGVEPFGTFTQDGVANQPLQQEQTAFAAVLSSLSSTNLAAAKLSKTYSDLVLKPGVDWQFPTTKEGLKVSTLSADQQSLVLAAMNTYVDDIDDADAKTILAKYQGELADTYIAWSGTSALTAQDDYFRIDGPSVWIEFSMQHGIVLSGNHPHSVWRDRNTDYGGTKS